MARYDTYSSGDDRIIEDLDSGYIGFNNRLRPDQLVKGILADSQNGRLAVNGEWQTRKGISNFKAPLATGSAALTLDFYLMDANITTNSVAVTSNELILNFSSAHGLGTSGSGQVQLDTSSLTVSPATASGLYTATVVDADTIKLTDKTYSSASGSVVVTKPSLADTAVNEVYGSCIFSDPNANSESYILLAANSKVVAVKVSDPSTTYDLAYPGTETVSTQIDMIQAFNKVFIFRDGDTAMSVDLATNNITGSPAFALVEKGAFTYPSAQLTTAFEITKGEAKGTKASHGYVSGDAIRVSVVGHSGLTLNDTFTVSRVDGDDFFFFVDNAPDLLSITSNEPTFIKELPLELGFVHMPAPKYGVYHQRRLAVPFRYALSSTETITDRKIFDEIILSDIDDSDTYQHLEGQFRFNAGKADFNVGMHSFSDDKLIVLNRNSIHIVIGSEDLSTSKSQLLTDEVGLVARRSVIQVGNQVLFLSDNGVYGANFIDLYNLRGNEVPLSEAIQKTIDRINKDAAENAVGIYFDNRYYLAVPLDGSSTNNAVIIYNFLNKSWESVDKVNSSGFEFTNLLVAGSGSKRGVYVTNTDGGIHKLETEADGIDRVITAIGGSAGTDRVEGSATTRMFTLNSIDRKKWNNFELQLQSSADNVSDMNISGITENVDSEPALDLKTASFYLGSNIPADEDVSIRGRIGNKRAYGFQMVLTNTLGRPSVRAVKVAGAETFRSTSSVQ